LPLEIQRVVSCPSAYLQQAGRAPFSEQVKEATPLADLERFLLPAIAFGRRGCPIRLTETGNDAVVVLHDQDRTGAAAFIRATASWQGVGMQAYRQPAYRQRYTAITASTERY
jgi:hypothetical protein